MASQSTKDILIAVMGPTGSGKSRFIDNLTQTTNWSGGALHSDTQTVRSTEITLSHNGQDVKVTLVDTPGFDDTDKKDTEILHIISQWLSETYRRHISLSGILFLHRITDNRMSGSPHRNLRMFGNLCGDGEEVAKKVCFVTTMWDKLKEPGLGERRESDLVQTYWEPMAKRGAHTGRSDNTKESAEKIIHLILDQQSSTSAPLLIQEEMVDLKRPLNETEAAKTLYEQFQTLLSEHRKTLVELERAAEDQSDSSELLASLQKERMHIEAELEKALGQAKQLKVDPGRRFLRLFQKKAKSAPVFD